MTGALTPQVSWAELLIFACHWLTLWLALSLLGLRPWSAPYALFGLASATLSAYFLATALLLSPQPVPAARFWATWLSSWVPLAPVLVLHSYVRLTGVRLPGQRVLLLSVYGLAGFVAIAAATSDLIARFEPREPSGSPDNYVAGPLYPLFLLQVVGTLAIAVAVLVQAKREAAIGAPVAKAIRLLLVGTSLLLVAAALMFVRVSLSVGMGGEVLIVPFLALGSLLVAVPLVGYPGMLGGQLLKKDLMSSLLGSAVLMGAFATVVVSAGRGFATLASIGWLILAAFVFRDHLLTLTDRVFFAASERAGRAGLRTAATFAGSRRALDLGALGPQRYDEVVDYAGELDRAELAAARLQESRDPRLDLLALEEYRPVRAALGLDESWSPDQGVPHDDDTPREKAVRLEPRERQVLGLRHLGFSDKEMASLLGVRPKVPTSYLSEAKHKLGLPAGPSLALFVHLSGFVERDALPLLRAQTDEGALAGAPGGPAHTREAEDRDHAG